MDNRNYSVFDTSPSDIITIKRLWLIPTKKRYQDIGIRPYELRCDNRNINSLENMIVQAAAKASGGLSSAEVVTNVPTLLNMGFSPVSSANIPNGWQTQRLRYLMEVESQMGAITVITYIQGFSEFYEPSISGYLDPNMRFYINSITTVKRMLDPSTGTYIVTPHHSFNIISDVNNDSQNGVFGPSPALIRPSDIYNQLLIDERYGIGEIPNITSFDRISPTNFASSRRGNNNPINYISNSIDAFVSSVSDPTSNITSNLADYYNVSNVNVMDPSLESTAFLTEISRMTGEIVVTYFTLDILERLNPGLEQSNRVTLFGQNELALPNYNIFLDTDDTASAVQPLDINVKASTISSMVPTIMLDCFLTTVQFSLTNISGTPEVIVTNARSFIENINIAMYIDAFIRRIKEILYPVISNNFMSIIEIYIDADILGDISMGISIDNSGRVIYRFPIFADSLFTPVINNSSGAEIFKTDFRTMTDTVLEGLNVAKRNYNVNMRPPSAWDGSY